MDAPAVIRQLAAAGISLNVRDGRLVAMPKERLTDDLRALIKANKPALLTVLQPAAHLDELPRLVDQVAKEQGFNEEERQEAQTIAALDAESALVSFRLLVHQVAQFATPPDPRVTCDRCGNFVRGQCRAAVQGLMQDTYRGYCPVPDVPRNCEHFSPKGH